MSPPMEINDGLIFAMARTMACRISELATRELDEWVNRVSPNATKRNGTETSCRSSDGVFGDGALWARVTRNAVTNTRIAANGQTLRHARVIIFFVQYPSTVEHTNLSRRCKARQYATT